MRRQPKADHEMQPRHWIAFFALWQVSVLLAAAGAWAVGRTENAPPPVTTFHERPPQELGNAGEVMDLHEEVEQALLHLRNDNEDLRTRVARLQREQEKLSRDYLKLSFRSAIDTAVAAPRIPRTSRAPVPWASYLPGAREERLLGNAREASRVGGGLVEALDAFDRSGLYELLDRVTRLDGADFAAEISASSSGLAAGGGPGNLEGLLQLRELEPLLELLLAVQSQGGGAGGGLGGFGGLSGGDSGVLEALQGLREDGGLGRTERERRILPTLFLLALLHDGAEEVPVVN